MLTPYYSVEINPHPGKGELTILFSGHAQTEPNHKVGPQVLDYHLVHYVVSGKGTFRCLGHEYALEAGSSFYIAPGELVSYASDASDPWMYRWIGFKGSDADQLLARLGITAMRPIAVSGRNRRVPLLFRRIEEALRAGDAGCDLRANGNMRLLLAEWAQDTLVPSDREPEPESAVIRQVEQAIRWLTLQYSQPVSIEHMAQTLGYHRTHLSKMFKQHTGMSPMNFLLKIRMERAKLLLAGTLTVEQVASSVGFADALYFSKQFKKWYGRTPTEYRHDQQHKERFDCTQ